MARSDIKLYEVSGGKSRLTGSLKGAGLAVFFGGALGALEGSLQPKPVNVQKTTTICLFSCGNFTYTDCVKHCGNMGPLASAFGTAILALPVGAITGAIIGSEKWHTVH